MSGSLAFTPGTSPIHRIDPRARILAAAFLAVGMFFGGVPSAAAVAVISVIAVIVAGIGPVRLVSAMAPVAVVILIISVVQLAIGGSPHVEVFGISISRPGAEMAGQLILRIIALLALLQGVVVTTSPGALAHALAQLLRPLRVLRIPVEDVALALALTLAFVPIMTAELGRIHMARRARGITVSRRRALARLRLRASSAFPLATQAFRRSHIQADAMRARGWRRGTRRTSFSGRPLSVGDVTFIAASGALAVALAVLA